MSLFHSPSHTKCTQRSARETQMKFCVERERERMWNYEYLAMNWCRYTKLECKVGVGVFIALLWEDCKITRGLEDQKKTHATTHQCNICRCSTRSTDFHANLELDFQRFSKIFSQPMIFLVTLPKHFLTPLSAFSSFKSNTQLFFFFFPTGNSPQIGRSHWFESLNFGI